MTVGSGTLGQEKILVESYQGFWVLDYDDHSTEITLSNAKLNFKKTIDIMYFIAIVLGMLFKQSTGKV